MKFRFIWKSKYILFPVSIILLLLLWLIIPITITLYKSSNSAAFITKENISLALYKKLIGDLKFFGILDEIASIKKYISYEKRHSNTGSMGTYGEDVISSEQLSTNIIYHSGQITFSNINTNFLNVGSLTKNNQRHYRTSKKFVKEIKLLKVLDTDRFTVSQISERLNVQCTPVFYDKVLYFTTSLNAFVAFDFEKQLPLFYYNFIERPAPRGFIIHKPSVSEKAYIFLTTGDKLLKMDAKTGEFAEDFGVKGIVRTKRSTAQPWIHNERLILSCNDPPSFVCYDVNTGRKLWENILQGKSGSVGSPWAGGVLDEVNGIITTGLGNPKPPTYGRSRPGNNSNSCSVISLDVKSGIIVSRYQDVVHDLWDLDVSSPPTLIRGKANNPFIMVPTKRGTLFKINASNYKLINKLDWRIVAKSDLLGESNSLVQPNFTEPNNYFEFGIKENEIKADLDNKSQKLLERSRLKEFAPPSLYYTVLMKGLHGGASWPGMSYDPDLNRLFMCVNLIPWKIRSFLQIKNKFIDSELKNHNPNYIRYCRDCHGQKLQGKYKNIGEKETEYIPSLLFDTNSGNHPEIFDLSNFKSIQEHSSVRIKKEEFQLLIDWILATGSKLVEDGKTDLHYQWSMALDSNDLPLTKGPYNKVISYDLENDTIAWEQSLGSFPNIGEGNLGTQINGGLASTNFKVLAITGTTDNRLHFLNSENGSILKSVAMEAAGSCPPMFFSFEERTFCVVVAGGGKYHGYEKGSGNIYIFEIL